MQNREALEGQSGPMGRSGWTSLVAAPRPTMHSSWPQWSVKVLEGDAAAKRPGPEDSGQATKALELYLLVE